MELAYIKEKTLSMGNGYRSVGNIKKIKIKNTMRKKRKTKH